MKKVYGILVYKPRNPLKWLFNDRKVEKIAEKHKGLIGFIKIKNGIRVLYETEEAKRNVCTLFRYHGYECDIGAETFITDDNYYWFKQYGERIKRWLYG